MDQLWSWLAGYLISPLTWMAFAFGAVIGSFLNVCIWRIPEGTFFTEKRSVCRGCGARIPAWLNVPILGWLILRGRARCCGGRIHWQYPLVELGTAVMFVILYWKFPFMTLGPGQFAWDAGNLARWLHGVIFASLLIVCSVIDLRHMIIPDVISLPMIAATPVVIMAHPDLDWMSGLLGAAAGAAVLYAIAWVYWLIRREVGMGMGDVKLLAGIGGWLGYQAIIPTILLGSTLGAIVSLMVLGLTRRLSLKSAIPFGPFLALGAIIHLVAGQLLLEQLVVLPQ